jgi:hypothetical protein
MMMRLSHCAVVLVFLWGATFAACGGKQQSDESTEPTVEEVAPTCVEEGWAQPPEGIGDTPPSQFPSPDTLKPFEHANPNEGSSSSATGAQAEEQSGPGDDRSPLRDEYEAESSGESSPAGRDTAGDPELSDSETTNESDEEESPQ